MTDSVYSMIPVVLARLFSSIDIVNIADVGGRSEYGVKIGEIRVEEGKSDKTALILIKRPKPAGRLMYVLCQAQLYWMSIHWQTRTIPLS